MMIPTTPQRFRSVSMAWTTPGIRRTGGGHTGQVRGRRARVVRLFALCGLASALIFGKLFIPRVRVAPRGRAVRRGALPLRVATQCRSA
jgi:hypothetical protein